MSSLIRVPLGTDPKPEERALPSSLGPGDDEEGDEERQDVGALRQHGGYGFHDIPSFCAPTLRRSVRNSWLLYQLVEPQAWPRAHAAVDADRLAGDVRAVIGR